MNIIAVRQEKRKNQIEDIKASIQKARNEHKDIDFDSIVMATASSLNLSKRTSREYVELALFELKLKKEDIDARRI